MRLLFFNLIASITILLTPPAVAQNTLAFSITESTSGAYDDDVNQALSAGATATSLTLFWDEADVNGTYAPEFNWPEIANSYYPVKGLGLILSLPVIDTVTDRRPADLKDLPFDDPVVIARFESFVGQVFARMPDTNFVAISIGNEVDGYLYNPDDWRAFEDFFIAAKEIIRRLQPDVPIGFTMTWQGMQGPAQRHALQINTHTDALFVNYYPLDQGFNVLPPADIAPQLDAMVALANGKPMLLIETGYPSNGCGSSEALQLAYVQQLMAAWDARKADIPLVNLVWLHDISTEQLAGYGDYYGVNNACFLDYLATLGLRRLDGQSKPAFEWLVNR